MTDDLTDYQRGLAEGARDALIEEHTARLNKINGSVERHAKSNEALTREMRVGFEKLAGEIRTMQEEARLDRERVKVTAETLASQRTVERDAAEKQSGAWSLRSDKATVLYLVIAIVSVIYALFH